MGIHRIKWHRDSIFGTGPRLPLDRNARARFLFLAQLHRRPGRLSVAALGVAQYLIRLLGADGRLDPSHATLAALARVHIATVKRALRRLADLGLLRWQRRLVRDEATGWRTEQTSNAYVLSTEVSCEAQTARAAGYSLVKKEAPVRATTPSDDRAAALKALEEVRLQRMKKLGLS